MATMYETIMNLPLFKGLSHEQISSFLEKTNIRFTKFRAGETIAARSETVDTIKCIISGKVEITHRLGDEDSISVIETIGAENVIGADRLFGMNTVYGADIKAMADTSIMEFGKEQFFNLLTSGPIYLINYVNYLSFKAQKLDETFSGYPDSSVEAILARIVYTCTSRNAGDIRIKFNPSQLANFTRRDTSALKSRLLSLQDDNIITLQQDCIIINDRDRLIDKM